MLTALAVCAGLAAIPVAATAKGGGGGGGGCVKDTPAPLPQTVTNPIQPTQLTYLADDTNSFWLQPWRSSLTTQPATHLQNAIGIDIGNNSLPTSEIDGLAQLLHNSGIKRARIELPWGAMTYGNMGQVDPGQQSQITQYLQAFKTWGIRPLILLNADQGMPNPNSWQSATLTAQANVGDTVVHFDPSTTSGFVPGLTGLNLKEVPGSYAQAAGDIITSLAADGTATLSRPLPQSFAAGSVGIETLSYPPFAPPYLADGKTSNPQFQKTLDGWLTYVKGILSFVKSAYGSDDFDAEVWNEVNWHSAYLDENNYYDSTTLPDPGSTGDTTAAIMAATVSMLKDTANGLTNVQIGDGFSNWYSGHNISGATVPAGTAAIDYHVWGSYASGGGYTWTSASNYAGLDSFGKSTVVTPCVRLNYPERPLNAVGGVDDAFRDLSPITTTSFGYSHGATLAPSGGTPPTVWLTESGYVPNSGVVDNSGKNLTAAEMADFQAKALLRWYVSWASEGAQAVYTFTANGGDTTQIVAQPFFNAIDANPSAYPGDSLGGLPLQAIGRFTGQLAGSVAPTSTPQQVTVNQLSNLTGGVQFQGNGTAATPDLTDANALAFFPFQKSSGDLLVATYVMSRDLSHIYTTNPAAGKTPIDMPDETFQVTLGNVNGNTTQVKSLYDPLSGTSTSGASIVGRTASTVTIQLPVTDSPRLLELTGTV